MERIIDKIVIFLCCMGALFFIPSDELTVIGLLCALSITSLYELSSIPRPVRSALLVVYGALACYFGAFTLFLPLIVYDCLRERHWFFRLFWVIPLIAVQPLFGGSHLFIYVVTILACLLSWKTGRVEEEKADYMEMRDELREASLALEAKNRGLRDAMEYEVRVATLEERARIAREIHDNVGHLLTRSVLQIEALQVVHTHDERITQELVQVSDTLHTAFDQVRASVHDLHEEAFDLRLELMALVEENEVLHGDLDYQVDEISGTLAHSLATIVREAITNTIRHSDATSVKVSLVEYPAFLKLVVQDNGTKDPFVDVPAYGGSLRSLHAENASEVRRGIGLRVMDERVRAYDGLFRFEFDKGFKVFVSIPKQRMRGEA